MAATLRLNESTSAPLAKRERLIGGLRFDGLMGVLSFLWMGGLYLDGWAHGHGKVDKTFFTPWHAILYSAFAITALCLVGAQVINHRRGVSWRQAIPSGYGLSVLGIIIFACAGPADLVWHTLFGFEVGIEPLLSPSHLALASGGILTATGPLRATLRRAIPASEQGWKTLFPMYLSLVATLMVFVFFSEFAHPFSHISTIVNFFTANDTKSFGVSGILLQTALLMGFILFAIRRWRLPLGSLTLLFAVYVTLLSVLNNQYELIPGVVVAGIIADVLLRVLRPASSSTELRVFAFAVPTALYLFFFFTLALIYPISWSVHLWLGSCVMAGVVGLMLSFLLASTQEAAEATQKQTS